MNSILVVLIALVLLALMVVIYLLTVKKSGVSSDSLGMLKQDLQGIQQLINQSQSHLNERIDKNNSAMQASVQKQMSESSKLIIDVTERLTKLDETNKRVVDVADELKTLQNVLQNPKQRGVLGEYYLQTVLDNVLPVNRYKLQYKFKDGDIVDAVIFLEKDKILPIDSKFSLENYNRLVEEKNKDQKAIYVKRFKQDLKTRIDETSKYIRPSENTMDFAFMFIPSEAIYNDLLTNKIGTADTASRDLIEYAFQDKKVIIVSPTTFMAYLQTVLQGLRSLQIEDQAKEIQKRVGMLGRHIKSYEEFMHKLGGSLSTTVNHYNNAHKELKKVDKDVVNIAGTDESVDPAFLEKPNIDD
ncbi:DNA recombination protein RmuC [Patescibacteria group bacterium]|nr:DNA recombination protein RmuC [Patescibacteria group bacterium]